MAHEHFAPQLGSSEAVMLAQGFPASAGITNERSDWLSYASLILQRKIRACVILGIEAQGKACFRKIKDGFGIIAHAESREEAG